MHTCAREYTTWENAYPEGTDRVRGVTVRRFKNAQTRDLESFNAYSDWIFANDHSAQDEQDWLKTGVVELNDAMRGGLLPGHCMVIIGRVNVGKSASRSWSKAASSPASETTDMLHRLLKGGLRHVLGVVVGQYPRRTSS